MTQVTQELLAFWESHRLLKGKVYRHQWLATRDLTCKKTHSKPRQTYVSMSHDKPVYGQSTAQRCWPSIIQFLQIRPGTCEADLVELDMTHATSNTALKANIPKSR